MIKTFLLFCLISLNAQATVITGQAYVKDKLVYLEKHNATISSSGLFSKIETEYLSEDQKVFAKIISDFSKGPFVPDVVFEDKRFNLIERISLKEKKLNIERIIDGKSDSGSLEIYPNSVQGQGFNNYIVTNFEKLLTGKLEVHFIISPKKDQYRFSIGLDKIVGENVIFKVVPQSIFLKAFVEPIYLTYDKASKRLMTFVGLSNLDDPKGKSQQVRINYIYQE